MAIRRWLIGGLAVCALSAPLWAKPGTVKTRDGVSYQGDVSETDDGKIVVKVHGIDMRIDRHDVQSIEYTGDATAELQKKLAALPPRDVDGRLALAKVAFNQKQYELATQAAQSALDADPNSRDATDFLTMIRKQQELEHTHATDPKGGDQGTLVPDQPGTPASAAGDHKLLAPEDVNVVKQMELGADENNFRVTFANDVRRRFAAKDNGGTLAQFMELSAQQQARFIMARQPSMRDDVRIQSDPASMTVYKRSIQPAILQGCATSGCHGSASTSKFILTSPADTDAATYTNFYLLTQYAKTVDRANLSMIDRSAPQKSLLLQYSLAPEVSDFDHPDVPGYKGVFRSAADPRYKVMFDWISNSLTPVAPDYGIKFGGAPATAPAKP